MRSSFPTPTIAKSRGRWGRFQHDARIDRRRRWRGFEHLEQRALFGQLVPWDSVWHPGADSATRVSFDHDVLIEDHALAAGEYSLWLVPREHGPWTVIFSRAAHVFHKPYPGPSDDVLRVDVAPESLSYVETLAIYFPTVLRDNAAMRIHWGTVGVPIRIKAPYRPASKLR